MIKPLKPFKKDMYIYRKGFRVQVDKLSDLRDQEAMFEMLLKGSIEKDSVLRVYSLEDFSKRQDDSIRVYMYCHYGIIAICDYRRVLK